MPSKVTNEEYKTFVESLKVREVSISPEVLEQLEMELENKIRWALGSTLSRPYGKRSHLGEAAAAAMVGLIDSLKKNGWLTVTE
jgi:hypothetical protein